MVLAKGNHTVVVTETCRQYGGFYPGSIGGPVAWLAKDHISRVDVPEFEELNMEAVWKIEVMNFPAFVIVKLEIGALDLECFNHWSSPV